MYLEERVETNSLTSSGKLYNNTFVEALKDFQYSVGIRETGMHNAQFTLIAQAKLCKRVIPYTDVRTNTCTCILYSAEHHEHTVQPGVRTSTCTRTRARVHARTSAHARIHTRACRYTHLHAHTHTRTCEHAHKRSYAHAYIHVRTSHMHRPTYIIVCLHYLITIK